MADNKLDQVQAIFEAIFVTLADLAKDIAAGDIWEDDFTGEISVVLKFWLLDRNLSILIEMEDPCIAWEISGFLKYQNINKGNELTLQIFDLLAAPELVREICQEVINRGGIHALQSSAWGLGSAAYDLELIPENVSRA